MAKINLKVNYRIVKLDDLSGDEASFYTVYLENEKTTLFEKFLAENVAAHREEIIFITGRLRAMAGKLGAREQYFKHKEGSPGDLVCALYDEPERNLRLYCIRFGKNCVLLGGGGYKEVDAWQDDPKLSLEAQWMKKVSSDIYKKIQEGEIRWSYDGFDLIGNLNFNQENEED